MFRTHITTVSEHSKQAKPHTITLNRNRNVSRSIASPHCSHASGLREGREHETEKFCSVFPGPGAKLGVTLQAGHCHCTLNRSHTAYLLRKTECVQTPRAQERGQPASPAAARECCYERERRENSLQELPFHSLPQPCLE